MREVGTDAVLFIHPFRHFTMSWRTLNVQQNQKNDGDRVDPHKPKLVVDGGVRDNIKRREMMDIYIYSTMPVMTR
jgi:hypothetical protein